MKRSRIIFVSLVLAFTVGMTALAFFSKKNFYPFLYYKLYARKLDSNKIWLTEFDGIFEGYDQTVWRRIPPFHRFFYPLNKHRFFVTLFFQNGFCEKILLSECRRLLTKKLTAHVNHYNSQLRHVGPNPFPRLNRLSMKMVLTDLSQEHRVRMSAPSRVLIEVSASE